MFRNAFNEPKPGNHLELNEAIGELGIIPSESVVIIADGSDTEDEPYNGWTADIYGPDDEGELVDLGTVAYVSLEALRNDLKAAGFTDITVE